MPFVLTVDQIDSQQRPDRVDHAIASLADLPTVLPYTRTLGDEFQGVMTDPLSVVDAILRLMRTAEWHIGLGIGQVEEPLPDDPRRGRGSAFVAARAAVEGSKTAPFHLAVVADAPAGAEARDVHAAFELVAALRSRRTDAGWEAIDLVAAGRSQSETASILSITRQAVNQRLLNSHWAQEQAARPLLARLLARTERVATTS